MKMEWKKPELEVLNINETMHGQTGDRLDASFDAGTGRPQLTFS
ncbi:paeninodin family lasso peptide [Sporosarcina sp. BP05]|nr:paeninodin family lasso peptide [Sporosarcina sp. BP05]